MTGLDQVIAQTAEDLARAARALGRLHGVLPEDHAELLQAMACFRGVANRHGGAAPRVCPVHAGVTSYEREYLLRKEEQEGEAA